jgi:hypothetical protein
MEINIPAVVAEVTSAFMAYERALSTNDLERFSAELNRRFPMVRK